LNPSEWMRLEISLEARSTTPKKNKLTNFILPIVEHKLVFKFLKSSLVLLQI
jgi:hypothetical protein